MKDSILDDPAWLACAWHVLGNACWHAAHIQPGQTDSLASLSSSPAWCWLFCWTVRSFTLKSSKLSLEIEQNNFKHDMIQTHIESIHNGLNHLVWTRVLHGQTCLSQESNTAVSWSREQDESIASSRDLSEHWIWVLCYLTYIIYLPVSGDVQ